MNEQQDINRLMGKNHSFKVGPKDTTKSFHSKMVWIRIWSSILYPFVSVIQSNVPGDIHTHKTGCFLLCAIYSSWAGGGQNLRGGGSCEWVIKYRISEGQSQETLWVLASQKRTLMSSRKEKIMSPLMAISGVPWRLGFSGNMAWVKGRLFKKRCRTHSIIQILIYSSICKIHHSSNLSTNDH